MPGMDGIETLENLKKRQDFHTPAIVLTADASAETGQQLREAGFARCLTKPVPWQKLKDALAACIAPDKVIFAEEKVTSAEDLHPAEQLLSPYGISLSDAMAYFEDFQEYCISAELFLRYDPAERERVGAFLENENCGDLRFAVHALKGKAGNLGMTRLEEISAYAEKLCRAGDVSELRSLLPYLLFVWQRAAEGLQKLMENRQTQEIAPEAPAGAAGLKEYLQSFQRKPALQWIAAYLREHPGEEEALQPLRHLTEDFRFDEAMEAYDQWIHERGIQL